MKHVRKFRKDRARRQAPVSPTEIQAK